MEGTVINGKTCLENIGKKKRDELLAKNMWHKDYIYEKVLIDSEYLIQEEFLVS